MSTPSLPDTLLERRNPSKRSPELPAMRRPAAHPYAMWPLPMSSATPPKSLAIPPPPSRVRVSQMSGRGVWVAAGRTKCRP